MYITTVQFTWEHYYAFQYNHGQYSKLAMGPLWEEIMAPFLQSRHLNVTTLEDMVLHDIPRMSLFSGHDDTLAALLISLGDHVWDGQWIPYASMMILEHHVITNTNQEAQYDLFPSGHAFRLLYNGKVITSKIAECSNSSSNNSNNESESDLCDLDILLKLVGDFAGLDRQGCGNNISMEQQQTIAMSNHVSSPLPPGQVSMMTVLSLALCALLVSSVLTTAIMVLHRVTRKRAQFTAGELQQNQHQHPQLDLSERDDHEQQGDVDGNGDGVEFAHVSHHFTIGDDEEEEEGNAHMHANNENQII
jgi:hypothetical protein